MHDIEPYHKWRGHYVSSEDDKSPFYGRVYSEFTFTNKIYNYYIHPQWDDFGSQTLYGKILFAEYNAGFACVELIGEWNDCINNDIMFLKREVIDHLLQRGISKFVILCDNVLNFHSSDDSYYEEWYQDVSDEGGWICFVNTHEHVLKEMESQRLQFYINLGDTLNDIRWRNLTATHLVNHLESIMQNGIKQLL